MSDYRLTIIEERHMLSALLFIYRSGKAAKTTIYENVSKNPRMPVKLDGIGEHAVRYANIRIIDRKGQEDRGIHIEHRGHPQRGPFRRVGMRPIRMMYPHFCKF